MTSEQFKIFLSQLSYSNRRQPLIMGILNCTPDSFSDGGQYIHLNQALERVGKMIEEGIDIIDIGGASSRPGACPISTQEELDRILPILEGIQKYYDIAISIDTAKPKVMELVARYPIAMINDISALKSLKAKRILAKAGLPVCLMHMQGKPKDMQVQVAYARPIVEEVINFFKKTITACLTAGLQAHQMIIDPGFGFGKLAHHNLSLIKDLSQLKRLQYPVLIGVSRKHTLGLITGRTVQDRLIPGLTMAIYSALEGVDIIRTHDIDATKQALDTLAAIKHQRMDFYQQEITG